MVKSSSGRILAILAVGVMMTLTAVDIAEARRAGGGGFGSRGTRTFSAPPVTRTAPAPAAPIDRTMSNQPTSQPTTGQQPMGQNRPANARPGGFFGGFGGSMLGGLMMGGLIGMMLGQGLGGGIGFMGLLLQIALVIGAVMLFKRMFGRNRAPAYAGGSSAPANPFSMQRNDASAPPARPPVSIPSIGGGRTAAKPKTPDEIGVGGTDLDQFENILKNLQAAYAEEDYAGLRKLTTPEAMSYLAEELSENATQGLKNEVRDVTLLQGDLSEAWNENGIDYATVAMRYESVDVMRDRKTGAIVSGDPASPTEAVEIWTFTRKPRGEWLVSAIQGVGDKAA